MVKKDELKKHEVFIEDIKKGDIIVIEIRANKNESYLVIRTGNTWMHKHSYFVTIDKHKCKNKWVYDNFKETQDRRFDVYRLT